VGRSPELSLTTENWNDVETAYGWALSNAIRQDIVEATNEYLASEVFERNAKPSRQAIDMIKSIKAVSDDLRKKLSTAGGDTAAFAQSAISEHLFSKRLQIEPYEQLFHVLGEVMFSLSGACTQALTELDDPNAKVFREGASWDQWIRALKEIAEQHELPVAASKAGNSEAGLGPFARLVEALQDRLPKQTRRHANTKLSSAIYSACRQSTEKIEESE
jgi:hypothetical protein